MIALFFTATLLLLAIYCFMRKKFLYLAVPSMLFLPEYYAIEFGESLPLLTATRIILIVFYFYAYINMKRNINLQNILIQHSKDLFLIAGYFLFRIISNLYYITTYTQPAKTILSIVFEQFLFLVAIYLLYPTKEEINNLLKVIVYCSVVIFIIGIFESITYYRFFDELNTVSRTIINEHYVRAGLLRSTTTMQMPGLFGNMCVLMLPLILYLQKITAQKRYIAFTAIDFLAIIHSGSRSDVMFFFIIIFSFICLELKHRGLRELKTIIYNSFCVVALLLVFIVPISYINPNCRYFYTATAKSVLNEFGCNYDLDEDAPEGVDGYGKNAGKNGSGGINSRTRQFSGITYAMKRNCLFGMGSGAANRNSVYYYINNRWYPYSTIDIALVEILYCEGALGLFAYFLLFCYIAISLIKVRKKQPADLYISIILYFLSYLLCTLSTANMFSFLILGLVLIQFYRFADK